MNEQSLPRINLQVFWSLPLFRYACPILFFKQPYTCALGISVPHRNLISSVASMYGGCWLTNPQENATVIF